VHACHPHGALPTPWACRMLSGPRGIIVVRASWPKHPTLIIIKKNNIIIVLLKNVLRIIIILLFPRATAPLHDTDILRSLLLRKIIDRGLSTQPLHTLACFLPLKFRQGASSCLT